MFGIHYSSTQDSGSKFLSGKSRKWRQIVCPLAKQNLCCQVPYFLISAVFWNAPFLPFYHSSPNTGSNTHITYIYMFKPVYLWEVQKYSAFFFALILFGWRRGTPGDDYCLLLSVCRDPSYWCSGDQMYCQVLNLGQLLCLLYYFLSSDGFAVVLFLVVGRAPFRV